MLSDEHFLRAIRADAADEAPWLIYADWLEERGDPRAALYRQRRRTNALGMQLVLVPRGSFWMGERGSQLQGEIPHEFYIGAYPVTQGQWQAVLGNNPSYFSRTGGGARKVRRISDAELGQFPVEQVSSEREFLQRLNALEKRGGLLYRLPTGAEWEYACRGGVSSQQDCAFDFYFVQPTNDLSSAQANFDGRHPAGNARRGQYLGRTTKVGSYQPNRLGIYDMHGNVYEVCQDRISASGGDRWFDMMRGGSWSSRGVPCRASAIDGRGIFTRRDMVGFRVAAVPSGE
jgi:uncharacterized protein (TIGR02996 family)